MTISTEEIKEILKDKLRITVERGHWISPNDRVVKMTFDGEEICEATFSVVQQREYEG